MVVKSSDFRRRRARRCPQEPSPNAAIKGLSKMAACSHRGGVFDSLCVASIAPLNSGKIEFSLLLRSGL